MTRELLSLRCGCGLVVALAMAVPCWPVEIGPGANLQSAVNALVPGDELVLQGGSYMLASLFTITSQGTADAPIVIRAKAGEVPVIVQSAVQNVINIQGARYLVLRGLTLTGGATGIRLLNASFVTVEDCHIHHTNAPGVASGQGIRMREGSYNNLVRDNVVHDTLGPCILLGGAGGLAANVVEGNLVLSCGDHGIQATADTQIWNNIVLAATGNGIHLAPVAPSSPGNLIVAHNTVIQTSFGTTAVRVLAPVGPVVIANNALFNASGNAIQVPPATPSVVVTGNAGTGTLSGTAVGFDGSGDLSVDLMDATYSAALPQDLSPSPGSLLIDAGDPLYAARRDFERVVRKRTVDIGAYRFLEGRGLGWELAAEVKPPLHPRWRGWRR